MLLPVVAVVVAPFHADSSPVLDGRLDDAAWQAAAPFTGFVQKDPDAGRPASEPTSVRVVYDGDALWIGISCEQQHSPRVARLTRRDRLVDSDHVEIDLDSRGTGRDAFHFEVNAAGVLVDALRYDDTEISYDWDENWEAMVATTDTGWSAEIRIPFRVLRYRRAPGQSWGLQIRRFISARQETDELAPIPRGEAGETSRYGRLGPFEALPAHPSLELRPFVLASLAHAPDGSLSPHASAGGDLKWHLTPTLTLDATVNPDFAQVEADQQVLNLTTYETFYPEKRPFFLEGADLFAAPIQVLYTRRIGRVPDGAVDPSPLYGAAKLIGAVGDTQVGALAAVTGENLDPASLYTAARVRRGLGQRGYVGMFATAVAPFDTSVAHDAFVGGIDSRWRSASGAYVVDGDVAASTIRGGAPRLQRDGIVIASGDSSPQGRIHTAKQDNGPIYDVTLEADGRRFDINDAGFLERANFIHTDWNAGWKDTTPGRFVRESTTQAEVFYWRNWAGERIDGGYQLNTQLTLASYWTVFTELHWRPWHFDDREVGNGVALQRSGRLGWELSVGSDPRRRWWARGRSRRTSSRTASSTRAKATSRSTRARRSTSRSFRASSSRAASRATC